MGFKSLDRIYLAQNKDCWPACIGKAINLLVL
jgi:hypothetical protein